MEFFQALQAWHWLILGLVLLAAEALGAGGFVLGAAIAALLQAALVALIPDMSWQMQLTIYAFTAVILSVLYWKLFRSYNEKSDNEQINDRASQMIGRRISLPEDLASGQGKIQFGDTLWRVSAQQPLQQGDLVEVKATQEMVLLIEKVVAE